MNHYFILHIEVFFFSLNRTISVYKDRKINTLIVCSQYNEYNGDIEMIPLVHAGIKKTRQRG